MADKSVRSGHPFTMLLACTLWSHGPEEAADDSESDGIDQGGRTHGIGEGAEPFIGG